MPSVHRKDGFTLVEVLVAVGIAVALFASLAAAFLSVKSIAISSRHRIQALQVVRGQLELLKGTSFTLIANGVQNNVVYDAGPDGLFGTADDLKGTLTTTVQDFLDMDGDGNATETSIDISGDGVNDPNSAKPVRVSFTWTERALGQNKTCTVFADTLIAA